MDQLLLAYELDPDDPTPLYAQLDRAIRASIASGLLSPGERLPTVRELAVFVAGGIGHGGEVARVRGPGIDDPPLDDPGVRAAERHRRRIRRNDELDPRRRINPFFHRGEGH